MKKINYQKYFENKNITKQGFGILGRGLGVVKFLLNNGANVLITDNKEESFFTEQILELKEWMKNKNINEDRIKFIFGEHRMQDFISPHYIISASGVAKNNIYIRGAKEKHISVYQESSLFLKIIRDFNQNLEEKNKIKIISITGTRGKTTTTQLIYKILKDYFELNIKDRNIFLAGNIQGISTIELLEKVNEKDTIVMEVDSWLAQGFRDIKFAPNVAVFTNLMHDHMNYYNGDMSEYFLDKAQTFLYQNEKDLLVGTFELPKYINEYLNKEDIENYKNSKSRKIFISKEDILNDEKIFESKLIGEHNKINISIAKEVAKELGVEIESIKNSIKNFSGVSGRLEFVKEENRVKYYNDTTATTGEATIAAINAFKDDNSKIILITGGRDKELEIENYTEKLILEKENNKIKKIIFLNDNTTTGTKKVLDLMKEKNFKDYLLAENLKEAIDLVKELLEDGDIILFSPGFASFGMFLNEYDRGERFLELIK